MKSFFNTKQISQFNMIIWTIGHIHQVKKTEVLHAQGRFIKIIDRWLTSEGPQGLKRLKLSYDYARRAEVADPSVLMTDSNIWLKFKSGNIRYLNSRLGCLGKAYKDVRTRPFVYSLLRFYTLITLEETTKPPLSSITDPYKGAWKGEEIVDLPLLCRRIASKELSPDLKFDGFVVSTKGSPNGHPAYTKSWWDYRSIKKLPKLYANIKRLLELSENITVLRFLNKADEKEPSSWGHRFKPVRVTNKKTLKKLKKIHPDSSFFSYDNTCFFKGPLTEPALPSKLVVLSEPGGKVRIVAMGDLFTQSAVKPIHDYFMRLLRYVSSDCTHDQLKGDKFMKKWTSENKNFVCFDLKNCTDRFPMMFQRRVVSTFFGEEVSLIWESIMVNRTFSLESNGKLRYINYSVGQPMGFLSSWPVMAFSHHVVVHIAARNAGIKYPNDLYRILGDDIVFRDTRLALQYQVLMVYFLGVDMSPSKEVSGKGVGEFCKRLYRKGSELYNIPPTQIQAMRDYPICSAEIIREIERRYPTRMSLIDWLPFVRHKSRTKCLMMFVNPFSRKYDGIHTNLLQSVWGIRSHAEILAWELVDNHGRFDRDSIKLLNEFYKFLSSWYIDKEMFFLGAEGQYLLRESRNTHEPSLGTLVSGEGFIMFDPLVEPQVSTPGTRTFVSLDVRRAVTRDYVSLSKAKSRLINQYVNYVSRLADQKGKRLVTIQQDIKLMSICPVFRSFFSPRSDDR